MNKITIYVSEKLKSEQGNVVYLDKETALENDENAYEADAWVCEHCAAIGLNEVYLSEGDAQKHEMTCILKPENKSYATSKWLGLELYPSYPRFEKKGRDRYVAALIGKFNKPYDTRTGEYLSDKDFYRVCKNWESREEDVVGNPRNLEVTRTKAYDKFVDILREGDVDE